MMSTMTTTPASRDRERGIGGVAERVRDACTFIRANQAKPPSLKVLASRAGLSPFHFQRTFKGMVGLTPKQFAEVCRMERFKSHLRQSPSITGASYDAGYSSSGRMYAAAKTHLGMTPGAYSAGGKGVVITCASAATPLGRLMIAATDRGVCFVRFGDSHAGLRALLSREFPEARIEEMRRADNPAFRAWMAGVLDVLSATPSRTDIPLDVRATAFQVRVWRYLQSVPAGEVRSYSEVARAVGRPAATRAVARACATNPIALLVPCHRVIRGDGSMGGYRWQTWRKEWLLEHERSARPLKRSSSQGRARAPR